MPIRLGYACINLTLPASTGHTLRLAALGDREKVRAVIERNLSNLQRIIVWNARHGIRVFRMGSHLIPFASHPDFPYDWSDEHGPRLAAIGRLARRHGQRLSLHPGQYINPASPSAATRAASIAELEYSARVLDRMGVRDGSIILHLGGAYGDPAAAMQRFVAAMRPHAIILRYLALEHDERVWNITQVSQVAGELGVPVVLDTLHHQLHPGDLSLAEALELALPTWGARRPKLHISSQARGRPPGSHADHISRRDWRRLLALLDGRDVDVMIEAKAKDLAVQALQRDGHL